MNCGFDCACAAPRPAPKMMARASAVRGMAVPLRLSVYGSRNAGPYTRRSFIAWFVSHARVAVAPSSSRARERAERRIQTVGKVNGGARFLGLIGLWATSSAQRVCTVVSSDIARVYGKVRDATLLMKANTAGSIKIIYTIA